MPTAPAILDQSVTPREDDDPFRTRYGDLLSGSYDCVDRIVLNAYYPLGHSPGGFRTWWRRLHGGSDDQLDNAHLMRLAGRFSRRVRAWAQAHGVPVVDCGRGERKHLIAEAYLADHAVTVGVFLILVAKAPASVWEVERSTRGTLRNLVKKTSYVNHYSFHIMDREWGHLTIKLSGHPPFGAQVMLNGHEYVACRAQTAGCGFRKEGNCFTAISDPVGLARVADTLSRSETIGRLGQVIERWIYSACLVFGLDLEEQAQSGFRYAYSVYQLEYSRNLLFHSGARMDQVFGAIVDRTRARLTIPTLRLLFGARQRPQQQRRGAPLSPRTAVVIERPAWDLLIFKLHFGLLTLKGYTKGEHVLRFEAIVHNTKALGGRRALDQFPAIVSRLAAMLERFTTLLDCVDTGFLADGVLEALPAPARLGASRVGGVDLNRPRMRAVLSAALALSVAPGGFGVAALGAKVRAITGWDETGYSIRQAAYDLRKLRAKDLVVKPGDARRYQVPPAAARTIAALVVLREQVIAPILAGLRSPRWGRRPAHWTQLDRDYEAIRVQMQTLFAHLAITTAATAA